MKINRENVGQKDVYFIYLFIFAKWSRVRFIWRAEELNSLDFKLIHISTMLQFYYQESMGVGMKSI